MGSNIADLVAERAGYGRLRRFVHTYPRVNTWISVFGGLIFFVGSILFLYSGAAKEVGTYLFIVGSLGMFVGSIGQLFKDDIQRDLRS
ncbi:hypothetical protein Mycch_0651 [Mycolicibacterium chubuense NBB4]|uniref:YrhK domain-containing protein n=1 Tax=Mycolicibacterium chubuense (strain NBB4) TaxID=710421 RepID=I4BDW2_MYCCN|nr:YrhK family protein [Mycolicibacterium chubuense]AFM15469.1 hypothetical protein Mycch_0651 [Mycolicibacterium chubuense NBB4]